MIAATASSVATPTTSDDGVQTLTECFFVTNCAVTIPLVDIPNAVLTCFSDMVDYDVQPVDRYKWRLSILDTVYAVYRIELYRIRGSKKVRMVVSCYEGERSLINFIFPRLKAAVRGVPIADGWTVPVDPLCRASLDQDTLKYGIEMVKSPYGEERLNGLTCVLGLVRVFFPGDDVSVWEPLIEPLVKFISSDCGGASHVNIYRCPILDQDQMAVAILALLSDNETLRVKIRNEVLQSKIRKEDECFETAVDCMEYYRGTPGTAGVLKYLEILKKNINY